VLEYGEKFWEAYLDRPKFLELSFLDGHDITGEQVRNIDEGLAQFLEGLYAKGWLNNTAIVLYSDHGLHVNGLSSIIKIQNALLELKLPFLAILLPRNVADSEYGKIMKRNEQKLIGGYDLNNIMRSFNGGKDFYWKGDNPFNDQSDTKTCYNLDMADNFCICN
jgi:hypothetical protein